MIINNVFTLDDTLAGKYNDRTIPVRYTGASANYSNQDLKSWVIKFEYMTWEDESWCGDLLIQKWVKGSIEIHDDVDLAEAIQQAFSPRYWRNCKPIVYIQNLDEYFDIQEGNIPDTEMITTYDGFFGLGVLCKYYDYFIIDRNEFLKSVIKHCKAVNIDAPIDCDIEYLNHLYDFLIATRKYGEVTSEFYGRI